MRPGVPTPTPCPLPGEGIYSFAPDAVKIARRVQERGHWVKPAKAD